MRPKVLTNKPLVEAILELKWNPSISAQSNGIDTDLRLFLGRFHDSIGREYPAFEVLPAAAIPEQVTPNIPKYRFRTSEGGWPLVQLGSGLITLNDTAGYSWDQFRARAMDLVDFLLAEYSSKIIPVSLELRYINAVYADFEKQDILTYLKEKFGVQVALPADLFKQGVIKSIPNLFGLQTAFPTQSPAGSLRFSLNRGKANDRDAVVWETVLHSADKQLPEMPKQFVGWLDSAHSIIEEWFFKLVEGDLLKQFL